MSGIDRLDEWTEGENDPQIGIEDLLAQAQDAAHELGDSLVSVQATPDGSGGLRIRVYSDSGDTETLTILTLAFHMFKEAVQGS